VPAAAVIQRVRALSGITGRKGRVGGLLSSMLKREAQPHNGVEYWQARRLERKAELPV
jgi:hypothetical protein